MKTSVELDEKKVALARSMSEARSLRELLDDALDALIACGQRRSLAELLGTSFFDGELSEMRERKRATRR